MNHIVTDHGTQPFCRTIQPLKDRILVKRIADPYQSLIIVPDVVRENSKRAEVLAVGPKVREVKPGDLVLCPGAGLKYPDWETLDFILIQEADVAGTLSED